MLVKGAFGGFHQMLPKQFEHDKFCILLPIRDSGFDWKLGFKMFFTSVTRNAAKYFTPGEHALCCNGKQSIFPCKILILAYLLTLVFHYNDVIMIAMESQITGVSTVCSALGSGADHKRSASLAFAGECTGGFPSQKPVTWSFDDFFDLHLGKRLNTQSWCRWFETPSRLLWRHCNGRDKATCSPR